MENGMQHALKPSYPSFIREPRHANFAGGRGLGRNCVVGMDFGKAGMSVIRFSIRDGIACDIMEQEVRNEED